ncbi:hypothetical protein [Psychromonas sp. CNPT3]|uniref:hypothetical protein n=1 Tax=Psychromonas sp. CNPT3 TaxID=314282 RepID=UPI00006E9D26|nr:hypothetical protein [Psychromonas sp. CNPT3]
MKITTIRCLPVFREDQTQNNKSFIDLIFTDFVFDFILKCNVMHFTLGVEKEDKEDINAFLYDK